jgi:hypothetical protein
MDMNGGRPLIPRLSSGMSVQSQSHSTSSTRPTIAARRQIRSRDGCLTCKRRKVKCDEQRPRCSHCERLNMECKWRPQQRSGAQRRPASAAGTLAQTLEQSLSPTDTSPGTSVFQPGHAVDEVFDYASFMWDYGDFWQQASPELHQNQELETPMLVGNSMVTLREY